MKELIFFIFLFSLTSPAVSPDLKYLLIIESVPLEPYSKLIHAIGMVEGMSDTTAYNEFERIARTWNGSGAKTIEYWKRIQQYL